MPKPVRQFLDKLENNRIMIRLFNLQERNLGGTYEIVQKQNNVQDDADLQKIFDDIQKNTSTTQNKKSKSI